MGIKTSIYLPDHVAAAVKASSDSPSVLITRGLNVRPLLTEGPEGERTWITRWYCEVPAPGTRFRVLHDEWHDESREGGTIPCREIYEIQVTFRKMRPDLPDERDCQVCGAHLHRFQPDDWPFVDDEGRTHTLNDVPGHISVRTWNEDR